MEEKIKEIEGLVSKRSWERPFNALVAMSPKQRDNIRQTLEFDWDKTTLECADLGTKSKLEAWEIIDCNIKGVAARLHNIGEQLKPWKYHTWRSVLARILDLGGFHYKADSSEEDLELVVLNILDESARLAKRKEGEFPTSGAAKIHKGAGMVAAIVKDIAKIWDDVLGSEDEPAIHTVYAICEFQHSKSA